GQAVARHHDGLFEQLGRYDPARLQADEALDDQRQRGHGTDDQGPDRPASGLYDGEQLWAPGGGAGGTVQQRRIMAQPPGFASGHFDPLSRAGRNSPSRIDSQLLWITL